MREMPDMTRQEATIGTQGRRAFLKRLFGCKKGVPSVLRTHYFTDSSVWFNVLRWSDCGLVFPSAAPLFGIGWSDLLGFSIMRLAQDHQGNPTKNGYGSQCETCG